MVSVLRCKQEDIAGLEFRFATCAWAIVAMLGREPEVAAHDEDELSAMQRAPAASCLNVLGAYI